VFRDVEELPPKGDEVLPKIAAACRSDLHIIDGRTPMPPGFSLGHGYTGWAKQPGDGLTGHDKGDAMRVSCGGTPLTTAPATRWTGSARVS